MIEQYLTQIRALPKAELHRHFEGSVRLQTLVDIARQNRLPFPAEAEQLRPLVQMMPDENHSSEQFLSKFRTLRHFFLSKDVIARITAEIIEDAALDHVEYMELRFTPRALCTASHCEMPEVVELVCAEGNRAAAAHNIQVRYIISTNRHESVDLGEQALAAALKYRDLGVVALDLAGDEANFSALPFRDIFRRAKLAGLGVTVHAGEWNGAASVWDAVGNLGAMRVGHGVLVLQDVALAQMLAELGIVLEVCPTSNVLSGIFSTLATHPLPTLIEHGIPITINTDDPSICNVTLSDELALAMLHMRLSLEDVKNHTLQALRAAFLSPNERDELLQHFEARFNTTFPGITQEQN